MKLSTFLISLMACSTFSSAILAQDLFYEPTVVTVSGVITSEKHFGPPGFGETPGRDQKVDVPVLKLDQPVQTLAKQDDPTNSTSFKDVKKMQIVGQPWAEVLEHKGQHVQITGSLFQRQSSENYTSVLITATDLAYKKKSKAH